MSDKLLSKEDRGIIRDERKKIAEQLYDMQGTVSQFGTAKECVAYNRALREAADKIAGHYDE